MSINSTFTLSTRDHVITITLFVIVKINLEVYVHETYVEEEIKYGSPLSQVKTYALPTILI